MNPILIKYCIVNFTDAPVKAITNTSQLTHLVGQTARFECEVSGDGNPKVYTFVWTRSNNAGFTEKTDIGVLEIPVTSVEQEDIYYCTPENVAGQGDPATMTLTVNSK